MAEPREQDVVVDFIAAETYLKLAREAHNIGDTSRFLAACKMVGVALCLDGNPAPRFHLDHLKK